MAVAELPGEEREAGRGHAAARAGSPAAAPSDQAGARNAQRDGHDRHCARSRRAAEVVDLDRDRRRRRGRARRPRRARSGRLSCRSAEEARIASPESCSLGMNPRAPLSRTRLAQIGLSTAGDEHDSQCGSARAPVATSKPLRSGSPMSRRISPAEARGRPERGPASAASPTTRKPSSSSRRRAEARNAGWSSTTSTVQADVGIVTHRGHPATGHPGERRRLHRGEP